MLCKLWCMFRLWILCKRRCILRLWMLCKRRCMFRLWMLCKRMCMLRLWMLCKRRCILRLWILCKPKGHHPQPFPALGTSYDVIGKARCSVICRYVWTRTFNACQGETAFSSWTFRFTYSLLQSSWRELAAAAQNCRQGKSLLGQDKHQHAWFIGTRQTPVCMMCYEDKDHYAWFIRTRQRPLCMVY